MLVEEDEKLEHSRAGVAWKEEGMARRKGGGDAI